MKYSEAMEFARLLDFEPDKAYASTFKRAMEAEEAFKSQMALESTFGAFVDDADNMRDENIAIATEAANAVTNALGKIATWFKNLLIRFKAMVRKIIFKARANSVEKTVQKMAKAGKEAGSTAPFKNAAVELTDEEVQNYNDALNSMSIVNLKMNRVPKTVNAAFLSRMAKQIVAASDSVEANLTKAMKNPSPNVTVDEINNQCKACAKAMKITTALLNKAVKAGAVQKTGDSNKETEANK